MKVCVGSKREDYHGREYFPCEATEVVGWECSYLGFGLFTNGDVAYNSKYFSQLKRESPEVHKQLVEMARKEAGI